jgi:hypothetical protein
MVYIPDDDDIISGVAFSASLQECKDRKCSINNNQLTMNNHIKSFVITFVVSCALVLVAQIDNISLATFKDGAILGILFGVVRAGVKGVLELLIAKFS